MMARFRPAGATGRTSTLKPFDHKAMFSVRLTTTLADHATGQVTTAPTPTIGLGDAPRATVKSKISGTTRVGKKLKATTGTWSLPRVTVSYQWLRGGKKIAVRVTARKAGYQDGTAVSKATAKIKAKAKAKKK